MYRTDERERHEGGRWVGGRRGKGTVQEHERGDRGTIGPAAASGAMKRPQCIVGFRDWNLGHALHSLTLFFPFCFFRLLISLACVFVLLVIVQFVIGVRT